MVLRERRDSGTCDDDDDDGNNRRRREGALECSLIVGRRAVAHLFLPRTCSSWCSHGAVNVLLRQTVAHCAYLALESSVLWSVYRK